MIDLSTVGMLHETTRKWICRRAFVACCLLPTFLVVGAMGYYHRPWRLSAINRDLSLKLQAKVIVDQTWLPRPGTTQYRGIKVRDVRTDIPLLATDRVQVDRRFGLDAIGIRQIEVSESGLAPLVRLLETWLTSSPLEEIVCRIDRLRLQRNSLSGETSSKTGSNSITLENLQFRGKPVTDPQGNSSYQLWAQADYRREKQVVPLRLSIHRQFVKGKPRLQVKLDLRDARLPGWVLNDLVPGRTISHGARYCGVIELETNLQSVHGQLNGQYLGLPLQHLLPPDSPYHLSGEATIDWDFFSWQDKRIKEAQGLLQAASGSAGQLLVAQATKLLYFQPVAETTKEPQVPFDTLACRFHIGEDGLTIWGECPLETSLGPPADSQQVSGCLISRAGRPLLMQPSYILPVAQLVRLAVPATHSGFMPATLQAQQLVQALPLPQARPSSESPGPSKTPQ